MTRGEDSPEAAAVAERPGLHRRLYDWVLHWAYTPYATRALVLLSFAESSFFPIPPDVMLLPMCLGEPRRALRFATLCSIASILGGAAGYAIGHFAWESGIDRFFYDYVPGVSPESYAKVATAYEDWNFWLVFTAGFSPIPYKLITITGGACGIHFGVFLLASAVSRSARFFLEALLLRRYGVQVREFVEKRLGLLSLLFCVILVGGFLAVKYLL